MAETLRKTVNMLEDETPKSGGNIRNLIPYHDLREWIEEADKLDEITRVDGFDTEEGI